jgi:DNA-binding response OmpR family regulator
MPYNTELLEGRRLFLADSAFTDLIALQWLAQSFDCFVAATAENLAEAERKARDVPMDAAILDTSLSGVPTHPVADLLRARDVPIVFTTSASEPTPHWINEPILRKPFRRSELATALTRAMGAA